MSTLAVVVSLIGQAWAENADGERRALEVGDRLGADETLIMEEGAHVNLDFGDNQQLTFLGEQQVTAEERADFIEQTESLESLESGEQPEPNTPAESDQGTFSEGHSFVQLVRIDEIIEADGFTPVTVARIQEVLRPFGLSVPQQDFVRESDRDGTRYDEQGSPEAGARLAELSISIDAVAGDDIVDATEAGQVIKLTGKVGGGVAAGDTVTVTVNGQDYSTTVNADGKTWQVDVPGNELVQDSKVQATVNSVEPNGNPVSESAERPYLADDKTPGATVELESGSGDNGQYNNDDTKDGKVAGTVTLDSDTTEPGDKVKITDKDGNVILERPVTQDDIDTGITVDVPVEPGDTDVEMNVDVTDPAGNTSSDGDSNTIDSLTPTVEVELEPGSGTNGKYNDDDTSDGSVEGTITFGPDVEVGDKITVTDKHGDPVLDSSGAPITDHELTQSDIDNGITVGVPVQPGDTSVELNVEIEDPVGNSSTGSDSNPADGVVVTAELTVSEADVVEGAADLEYTVTLKDQNGNPITAANDITATTELGSIIILQGGSSGTLDVPVQSDDVYIDPETVTNKITGITEDALGGNAIFENLTFDSAAVSTEVKDTIDTTTVSLDNSTVNEGEDITLTATVDNAPKTTPLVLTLNNGETITIAVGQTTGSATFANPNGEDVYLDDSTETYSITSSTGNDYENLDTAATSTVTVVDTIDTSTVTLADVTVNEGADITISASVDHAPEDTDLILTLDNGKTITISVGDTTGDVTFTNPKANTPYEDGETQEYEITGSTGGNYENLDISDKAIVTVEDTSDTTTVTLNDSTVDEGGNITITATVDEAPEGSDLVLTLSNGEQITILDGGTTGSVTFTNPNGEDVYQDGETLEYSIAASSGGNYQDLDTTAKSTITIQDTSDTVTAKLTVSKNTVDEGEADDLVYTVTLEDSTGSPVITNNTITINTTQGDIVIDAGNTHGTINVPVQPDDAYDNEGPIVNEITGITETSAGLPGSFENLATDGTAVTTTVNQDTTPTTITLSDITGFEGENHTITATVDHEVIGTPLEIKLDNGQTITIAVGDTTSTSDPFEIQSDDVYVDGESYDVSIDTVTGGNFEQVIATATSTVTVTDTIDTTSVSLTAGPDLDETGGTLTYTVTLGDAVRAGDTPVEVSFKDLNGVTQTITVNSGTTNTLNVAIDPASLDSDVYKDAAKDIAVATDVTVTGSSDFEALGTPSVGNIELTDSVDLTTATLTSSGSGDEDNGSVTYTVTLDNPAQDAQDFTIELSNGQTETITVAAGATTGDITFGWGSGAVAGTQALAGYPDADVYLEPDFDLTVDSFVADGNGGNLEQLDVTNDTTAITISDTQTPTTITLSDITGSEGEMHTITATVDHEVADSDLVITLSNGETITIAVGQTSATSDPFEIQAEDVYVDGEVDTVSINTVTGGNFEEVTKTATSTVTVNDTIDPVYAIIEADTDAVLEGGSVKYTVKLVDESGDPVEVPAGSSIDFALEWEGTADASDVNSLPGSITINGGDSESEFTVETNADGLPELSEQLTVIIESVTDTNSQFEDLQIGHVNNNTTVTIFDKPSISSSNISVLEKGLTDGSSPGDGSETAIGTLRVTAPTPLESITIGGTEVLLADLQALSGAPQTITIAGHGELTISSFTPTAQVNGEDVQWDIDYSYELIQAQTHNATNPDELLENINLCVKAEGITSGTSITGSGNLGVLVTDDVPEVDLTGVKLNEAEVIEAALGTSATVDFAGAFDASFGADEAATNNSLTYELVVKNSTSGLTDTATEKPINLVLNGDVIEGVVDGSTDVAFTITLDQATGKVTLNQSRALEHDDPLTPNDFVKITNGAINIKATATDGDGDEASAEVNVGDRFIFQDDGPTVNFIGSEITIDEAHLSNGSDPQPVPLTSGKKDFTGVDFGADGVGDVQFTETDANSTVEKLIAMGLESDQKALEYELSPDGHTLIAYRGDPGNDDKIFTVEIVDAKTSNPGYQFTLNGPLDHLNEDDDQLTNLNLGFGNIVVTDGDGDTAETSFNVKVKNDEPNPAIEQPVTTDEDEAITFNSNADATKGNTTVGDGTDDTIKAQHGTVTVESNGQLTYTPLGDYSGEDEFTYTTTTDSGVKTYTVKVTVNPVADAPNMDGSGTSTGGDVTLADIDTVEDTAVALGLHTPIITDDTDQNGSGVTGDNPELLGGITLTLSGGDHVEGVKLSAAKLDGTSAIDFDFPSNGTVDIWITDIDHPTDLTKPAGVLEMTSDQYESLQLTPAEHRHENIDISIKASSYEVDGSGNIATVGGSSVTAAESEASLKVYVKAVTDDAELIFDTSKISGIANVVEDISYSGTNGNTKAEVTINEDAPFKLNDILEASFEDLDGSEVRSITIENTTGETIMVDGAALAAGDSREVDAKAGNAGQAGGVDSFWDITLGGSKDFSGDLKGIKVTINAQDKDGDGFNSGNDGSNVDGVAENDISNNSIELDLLVKPIAGDVELKAGDITTPEDTAVAFMDNIEVTDKNVGGSTEIITKVAFELPTDWELTSPTATSGQEGDAFWSISGAGSSADPYIIEFSAGSETNRELALKQFEVTPPAHSSTDETISVTVTTTDTNTVDGKSEISSVDTTLNIPVEVTPVAERTDKDTDGANGNDVTMTPGRSYTTAGEEDTWFKLGVEGGFKLGGNWTNEDSTSELTFAQLTPKLISGDGSITNADGSSFRYKVGGDWVEETFVAGAPINVPVDSLNTLEFKAAKDFSGSFEIKVEALTRDYDEDDIAALGKASIDELTQTEIDGLSYNEAVSGEATLENVLIKPVADTVTTTVTAYVKGDEDEQMPLSIRPKSSDPSETFNVTVSEIPDGATITYDGQVIDKNTTGISGIEVTPPASPGDKWSIKFTDFDPVKGDAMTMTAPKDSNDSFDLNVSTVSVDTMEVPSDPNSSYEVESAPQDLTIKVSPKGVADEADVEITDVASQTFTEESVETNGGINLNDLVTKAELKDTDASEALTFKVDGLPEGFAFDVGTVTVDGTWSLTEAQLQTAKITTRDNFSGEISFNFTAVTTENDGDSLSKTHVVKVEVDPTPEATINLADSVEEDTSGNLSFAIEHQNKDTDERLDEVWIKATDADSLINMELTFGKNGGSLADAAADAGQADITTDGTWYKLSGSAINNIYAQGNTNWAGNESFDVHYVITDPAQYPLGSPDPALEQSKGFDASYQVTVTPVTDTPELAITSSSDITMTAEGATTVDLNITNQGEDYDSSETLTRIVLENVPDAVTVQGAEYLGDGTWMITAGTDFNSGALTPSVTLDVGQEGSGLANHKINIRVITEDSGNGDKLEATQEISLSTNFTNPGTGDAPADIETWEQTTFEPTEDTDFKLSEAITGKIEDGVTGNKFTITLKDLPEGADVTGMVESTINGKKVWTATSTGAGDNFELQSVLDSITVKPPKDWNSNQGDFTYDAKLTTYLPGGVRFDETANINQQVVPVTDDAVISISASGNEGTTIDVSIDASNSSDDPNWTLVDGKLYLTLNEPAGMEGGKLQDASGGAIPETTVTSVSGITDGNYYVVTADTNNQANVKYQPKDGIISGDVGITAAVVGQEDNASASKTTKESGVIEVKPVNSGYDFSVANASGTENALAQAAADNSNLIEVSVTDNGLVDTDGSEEIGSVLLKDLPNGFLVYSGVNEANATLADNIGADGNANTWLLGDGQVPGYIGILPPANWSGSLTDLGIVINSKETALDSMLGTEHKFDLNVEAVANSITINPTASFGNEGEIITLNLNAEMEDLREVILNAAPGNPADDSVETATLQLKGLGEHASFYIGNDIISDGSMPGHSVNYDGVSGVYTVTGLSQDDLGKLGFVQAEKDVSGVEVRAQTIESANGDTSDWTHADTDPWASVTTNISKQFVTGGDDTLLWSGDANNGRGGEDTIQLRFEDNVSASDLADNLKNIEAIDLGIAGSNTIGDNTTGLSIQDVLDMTDSRNELTIEGDGDDSVFLSNDWSITGTASGGYMEYTNTTNGATISIAEDLYNNGNVVEVV